MAKKVYSRLKPEPRFGKTYIRQWRKSVPGMTLERLSERLAELYPGLEGTTHASLGRIERGKQPYNQALLEALADCLNTDVGSLLMRDPSEPEPIWTIWDQAAPGQRRQIIELAKALLRTGT